MKVRARLKLFYNLGLYRPGDTFTLTDPQHFDPSSMQQVADDVLEHRKGPQGALDETFEELTGRVAVRRADAEPDLGVITSDDRDPFTE